MYDRYTIAASIEALKNAFQVTVPEGYKPSYNAIPTMQLPVLIPSDPVTCKLYHWGLPASLSNNKSISLKLFNLPAHSAFHRPVYRKLIEKNRCVILADGFYIWKQLSKKQKAPYYCYFSNRSPFGIAGIWEEYEDLEGNVFENFNMITVSSTHALSDYQDDMPALLNAEALSRWLDSGMTVSGAEEIIRQVTAQHILLHAVSPMIVNAQIDDERLIKPTTPSDQFGNYTLFS